MSSYSDYSSAAGQLIQQQGEILARAELAKGAARSQAQANNAAGWGNAVNQITHTLTNIPAQQAQAKELQLREQEQQLRNQALQGQVKAQEQQRLTSQQANQIVATFPRNPDNTYNVVGIQGKLAQIGIPLEQQKGVLDVIEGMNKIATSFNAAKIDHAADAAHLLISQHPAGQPWAWADVQLSAAALKPTGLVSDEDQKLIDQAAESGANPEAFLKAMRDKNEKYKDYDKRTAETAKAQSEAQREALITAGTGPTGITAEKQATLDQTAATARTNAEDKKADNLRADDAAKRLEAAQRATEANQRATLDLARERLAFDKSKPPTGSEGGKLSAAAVTQVAGIDTSLSVADKLEKLVKPEWLGPVDGRKTKIWIATPGVPIADDLAQFAAETATLKNAIVKAITGAQMSEPEAKRIMAQIPDWTDKPNVWKQKLASTRENLKTLRDRTIELSGGVAPVVSHTAPTTAPRVYYDSNGKPVTR